MLILEAEQTAAALPFDRLIPALRDAFISGATVPLRHRHDMPQPDGTTAAVLMMPAWRAHGLFGVKVVSVFPNNGARDCRRCRQATCCAMATPANTSH